jgi:uncharacterized DUF497 family protein
MDITFEWDIIKANANYLKHKVGFDEARTVFYDDLARIKPDPDNSISEQRYLIIGQSEKNRLLVVSFTDRYDKIRIINARKSTNSERRQYEENL